MRKLVLWGQAVNEYRDMFDLSEEQMNSSILEFGCGPSAVNFQQNQKHHQLVSCDPLFVLDKDTLASKTSIIFADMAEQIKKQEQHFDFSRVGGYEKLLAQRQKGLQQFFSDYEEGKAEKRYIGLTDYHLPFADFTFKFALSAHYLFADLEDQSTEFHLMVLKELARVAEEVRIFPLMDREGHPSDFLGPVLLGLQQENYGVEVRESKFHLYQSDNAMLRIWAQQCTV